MRKFGIIGGMGPEATVDYYKRIVQFFHQHNQGLSTPEILIYSTDITALFSLVEDQRWDALEQWLLEKVAALKQAGAEFAAISANTPHIVFDRLEARSPLPLISIVEATLAAAQHQRLKRVGLLGTRFTMQANFFGQHFAKAGIQVFAPSQAEQDYLHEKLVSEIEHGIFTPQTKQGLLAIIEQMVAREGVEAIILGCTELPLVLSQNDTTLPLLNTTELHVAAICQHCLQPA